MADTLTRGPDREPSRWTSPVALAVAGIMVVVLALVIRGVLHRPAARPRAAEPTVHARLVPVPPVPSGATGILGPKEAGHFVGRAARPGGTRLLLTGPRPGWLTGAGRFQPIAGLPRSATGYTFTRVFGGWVAQKYSPPQADCQECDAPPAIYYVADGGERARYVAAAYDAVAAASPGELWVTAYLPDADLVTASGTAQLVTTSGLVISQPSQLPAGYVIDRAVKGGLLLEPFAQGPGLASAELWNPVTGRVSREFPGVITASADQVAWDPCPGKCPLTILDLRTGARLTIPLGAFGPGAWAGAGTFSADGRLLAVRVSTTVQVTAFSDATRLAVVSTASGRLTILPGTAVSSLVGESFGWQARGDQLQAALARPGGLVQVASWQPGDRYLSVRYLRLPSGSQPVLGDHS
jgi:hypothetical protein